MSKRSVKTLERELAAAEDLMRRWRQAYWRCNDALLTAQKKSWELRDERNAAIDERNRHAQDNGALREELQAARAEIKSLKERNANQAAIIDHEIKESRALFNVIVKLGSN